MPDLMTLAYIVPIIVVAYTVFGLVGFGSTLVSAPLLAHVLPVSTVIPVLALGDLAASWSSGWRLGEHVVRQELKRIVPPMIVGSALGAGLLFSLPLHWLMPLLGGFVVLYALRGLRHAATRSHLSLAPGWAWWYGASGGVLSALFGAGGWVYSIYLSRRLADVQQIRATQTVVLMFSSVIRIALFALAGRLVQTELLLLVLCLLPALALGLYIGHHISLKLPRQKFLQLLHLMLLLTGLSLLLRSWL